MNTTELTREAVLAMPAGRDLDCWIAERIFGIPREQMIYRLADGAERILLGPGGPEDYSTDIAAAWFVVEKMRAQYSHVSVVAGNGWGVTLWNVGADGDEGNMIGPFNCNTAPLAICRAALLSTL